MASLHIDNLPERVLRDLQNEAARGARNISEVAAERLARSFGDVLPHAQRDADELLRLADSVRTGRGEQWMTPDYLRAARENGRA